MSNKVFFIVAYKILSYLKNDSSMMEAREQIGRVQKWLPIIK